MTIRSFPNDRPESNDPITDKDFANAPAPAAEPKLRQHRPRPAGARPYAASPEWNPEQFTACGVIIRTPTNRILVSQRAPTQTSPGTWQIPGGKVKGAETWQDTAVRETLEETGLTINAAALELLGDWSITLPDYKYHAVVFLLDWPDEIVPALHVETDKNGPWDLMAISDLRARPEGMIEGLRLALNELVVPEPIPLPPPKPPELKDDTDTDLSVDPIDALVDGLKQSAEAERQAAESRRTEQRYVLFFLMFLLGLIVLTLGIVTAVLVADHPAKTTLAPAPAPVEAPAPASTL